MTFTTFLIIVLIMTIPIKYTKAECCYSEARFIHECDENVPNQSEKWIGGGCVSKVCRDGTPTSFFCGYGSCNAVGCNCDGGCREGTTNIRDLMEVFSIQYRLQKIKVYRPSKYGFASQVYK